MSLGAVLGPILGMVRKDLKLFFGDRRAVVVTLITPIVIAAFFGFLFSGNNSHEQAKVQVCVADLDGSALSKAVLDGLSKDATLEVRTATAQETRELVRKGKAAVGLVLPKGFGDEAARALFGGSKKPALQFLYDPSHAAELAMVRGILTEHAMEAVSREVFTGAQGRTVVQEDLQKLEADTSMKPEDRNALKSLLKSVNGWQDRLDQSKTEGKPLSGGLTLPYTVSEEAVTGKVGQGYNGYAHSFAGMGIQFILFAAIELGVGVLLERQMGLWQRLKAAPVSKGSVILGKASSGAIIALVTLGTTLGAGMAVFGVRVNGSWGGLLLLVLASCAMSASFGLMLAAFGKTPAATRGIAIFVVLLLTMLGGGWVPAFLFPAWMQTATLAVPTRWALDGLDAVIWRGGDFGTALVPAAVLVAFTALFGLLATLRFPWNGRA
jgi:ABC-2 type transport system permease protein